MARDETAAPGSRGTRFVFLDRDGTLVHDGGYVHRVEDYRLLPGVIEALQALRDAGFRFAIVTNQSGIARGLYTEADFERFQRRLLDDLEAAGIAIEATYMCPHLPDARCSCRKPSPQSVLDARDRFAIDLADSWVIGDHAVDVRLAANAGCSGILLLTGHGNDERHKLGDAPVAAIVADLPAAADHILTRARDSRS
ncbi:HAD family hydrolase [Candidatus Binatia bacterium]|nr:HAD family hydrolase [Candidatus Binatia bacterium]